MTAVANEGYVFSGWSDLIFDETRNIANVLGDVERVAYFERIEKTFSLNYGEGNNFTPKSVTLSRNDLKASQFAIPRKEGYTFLGWYADKDYTVKVANENGVYMLGLQGLNLETDTLYARWKKNDEAEGYVYKVLLVYTSRVQATLYSGVAERNIDVDYEMPAVVREYCLYVSRSIALYLNEWFKGKVHFEVDSYYTLDAVTKDCFKRDVYSKYIIYANNIPEIEDVINNYGSMLTMVSINDFNYLLYDGAGLADGKGYLGTVLLDTQTKNAYKYLQILQNLIASGINAASWAEYNAVEGFMHELIHTVEQKIQLWFSERGEWQDMDYHTVCVHYGYILAEDKERAAKTDRLYLLGEVVIDGKTYGISFEYWQYDTSWGNRYSWG